MLETRQLHPTLAREVVGLRLWERLEEATVAELCTLRNSASWCFVGRH
jgi:hypothetical protein